MFEKCVAIDWSGAQTPRRTKKIQVAEYDSHTHNESSSVLQNVEGPVE